VSPGGWQLTRLRYLAQLSPVVRTAGLDPDSEVTFVPLECVWPGDRLDTTRTRRLDEVASGYTRFAEGDVLVPRITPTFEARRSAVARGVRHGGPGFGTTELHVMRPNPSLSPDFLAYRTLAHDFIESGSAAMVGVAGQRRVPPESIKDFRMALPPLEEQRRITTFLDVETAHLDGLLERKRRVLTLLNERERAETTAAIVEVKPTHGRVPLMHLVDSERPIMYGIVLPGPHVPDGVLLVKGGNVETGRICPELLNRTASEIELPYARSRLRAGDLLVSIRGSFGAVALVSSDLEGANITQDAARVAPKQGVVGRWLYYALRSAHAYSQMAARATGATIRGVNVRDLKRIKLPVPASQGQKQLAGRLDRASQATAAIRSRLEEQLRVLNERRQVLITAAVTGELDPSSYSRPRRLEAA